MRKDGHVLEALKAFCQYIQVKKFYLTLLLTLSDGQGKDRPFTASHVTVRLCAVDGAEM